MKRIARARHDKRSACENEMLTFHKTEVKIGLLTGHRS
jgi:hypothetical protein